MNHVLSAEVLAERRRETAAAEEQAHFWKRSGSSWDRIAASAPVNAMASRVFCHSRPKSH